MAKRKRTNNDLQNTTQKNKDWATQIPLKLRENISATEGLAARVPLVAPVVLLFVQRILLYGCKWYVVLYTICIKINLLQNNFLWELVWPSYCLSFDLLLLITSLVSFGHPIVCPLIYNFWLPLWYLLAILLFVLWFTTSDYLFGISWPSYCLSFDLQFLITSLVSFGHVVNQRTNNRMAKRYQRGNQKL
jgi:hypothetical protein